MDESMSKYIRYDCNKRNGVDTSNSKIDDLHETTDSKLDDLRETTDTLPRCVAYMSGYKCHKGEYCDRYHRFPREDKVVCKDFKEGGCQRPASECWYHHPREVVANWESESERHFLVQPMGDLIKYLRKEEKQNPNKYKDSPQGIIKETNKSE